jgi:transposase
MAKSDATARLAVQYLPSHVWEMVEPLIPNLRANPKTTIGRKPVPHREALSGILYVLRMGVSWEDLPLELGWGTGMTCWRRVRALQRAKVWPKIVKVLAANLPDGATIPFDRMSEFRPRGPRVKKKAKKNSRSNGVSNGTHRSNGVSNGTHRSNGVSASRKNSNKKSGKRSG